jgi:hypothetical protein
MKDVFEAVILELIKSAHAQGYREGVEAAQRVVEKLYEGLEDEGIPLATHRTLTETGIRIVALLRPTKED